MSKLHIRDLDRHLSDDEFQPTTFIKRQRKIGFDDAQPAPLKKQARTPEKSKPVRNQDHKRFQG